MENALSSSNKALEQVREMLEAEKKANEIQKKLPLFRLGQTKISCSDMGTILKAGEESQDLYQVTGPVIEKHEFNPRPTLDSNIKRFLDNTNKGVLFKPFDASHLVKILVKGSHVNMASIAPYGGENFPDLAFLYPTEGSFKMGNGHHRFYAQHYKFKDLIESYDKHNEIITNVKTKESGTDQLKHSREKRTEILKVLYEQCNWGAEVYDLGM